jgi:hypothetical protein
MSKVSYVINIVFLPHVSATLGAILTEVQFKLLQYLNISIMPQKRLGSWIYPRIFILLVCHYAEMNCDYCFIFNCYKLR